MKRERFEVSPVGGQWGVFDRTRRHNVGWFRTKREAVKAAVQAVLAYVAWANLNAAAEGFPKTAQLHIKGLDGRIQEERTYPRSSDPRRTKG